MSNSKQESKVSPGVYGTISKIQESLDSLLLTVSEGDATMTFTSISDLLMSVEAYAMNMGHSLHDIISNSPSNREIFDSKYRVLNFLNTLEFTKEDIFSATTDNLLVHKVDSIYGVCLKDCSGDYEQCYDRDVIVECLHGRLLVSYDNGDYDMYPGSCLTISAESWFKVKSIFNFGIYKIKAKGGTLDMVPETQHSLEPTDWNDHYDKAIEILNRVKEFIE